MCNCNNEGGSGIVNCANTVPLVLETGDKVNIRTVAANHIYTADGQVLRLESLLVDLSFDRKKVTKKNYRDFLGVFLFGFDMSKFKSLLYHY